MFKYFFQVFIISITIIYGLSQECFEIEDRKPLKREIQLRDDLLCSYNKHFVPLHNRSTIMSVDVSMKIFKYGIHEIPPPKKMYLESEITVKWHDVFLMWNPADYDSMIELEMNTDEIWSPQIMPINLREFFSQKTSILASTECKVTFTGNVSCTVISSHTGYCTNDEARWPYDEHECKVQYMVCSYTGQDLFIKHPEKNISTVRRDGSHRDWTIIDKTSSYLPVGRIYGLSISKVYFEFTLVRIVHGGQMMQFYFLPIFVMTSLTLMCFWANFKETDRLILGLINIVYHILVMQDMGFKFPDLGDSVPYHLCFYRDSLVFAFVFLVETMVFKKILTSEKPAPSWLIIIGKTISKRIIGKILLVDGAMEPKNSEQGSFEDELRYIKESKHMEKRRTVQIIDRFVFIAFVVAYFIMITILLTF